jgi:hypothetical protein
MGTLKVADDLRVEESVADRANKLWFAHNQQHQEVHQTTNNHLRNIQIALEHRLQIAKEKGDRNLVAILEKEKLSYFK